jgi:hypothetical protein
MLPNTNGTDSVQQRYEKCVRWYNIAAGRYNSAAGAWDAADRELTDAELWLNEARDDLNRAASVAGLPGAP